MYYIDLPELSYFEGWWIIYPRKTGEVEKDGIIFDIYIGISFDDFKEGKTTIILEERKQK